MHVVVVVAGDVADAADAAKRKRTWRRMGSRLSAGNAAAGTLIVAHRLIGIGLRVGGDDVGAPPEIMTAAAAVAQRRASMADWAYESRVHRENPAGDNRPAGPGLCRSAVAS